jgi:flagellar protein FliS
MNEDSFDNRNEASDAEKVRVISLLYEGAINFNKTAKKKCELGDSAGKELYIKKVSAIIRELSNSLNMDAGELSNNLKNLYEFIHQRLAHAESNDDAQAFDDVEKVLGILSDGWREVETGSISNSSSMNQL